MADEDINIEEEAHSDETPESVKARRDLLVFWLRMIGWVVAGVAAPITTFSIKFGLFTEYGYQAVTTDELGNVTGMHVALNGWGIISCALIGFTIISVLNEIIDAYSKKYSFTKQILIGLRNRIIPIAIAIAAFYFLKGCMEQIIFCLTVIGIGQLVAIPINPLPKWKAEKKGEEDYSDILTGLRKFLKRENKKGDK